MLCGLAAVLRDGGRVEVLVRRAVGRDRRDGVPGCDRRAGDPGGMARVSGWTSSRCDAATTEEVAGSRSSWARRLGAARDARPVWRLDGVRADRRLHPVRDTASCANGMNPRGRVSEWSRGEPDMHVRRIRDTTSCTVAKGCGLSAAPRAEPPRPRSRDTVRAAVVRRYAPGPASPVVDWRDRSAPRRDRRASRPKVRPPAPASSAHEPGTPDPSARHRRASAARTRRWPGRAATAPTRRGVQSRPRATSLALRVYQPSCRSIAPTSSSRVLTSITRSVRDRGS